MFEIGQRTMQEYKEPTNSDQIVKKSLIKISGIRPVQPTQRLDNVETAISPFDRFLMGEQEKQSQNGQTIVHKVRFEESDAEPFDYNLEKFKRRVPNEEVCDQSSIIQQHGQNTCKQVLSLYYNFNYMKDCDFPPISQDRTAFQMVNIKPITLQFKLVKQSDEKKQERFLRYLIIYSKATQSVHFSDQVTCWSHSVAGDFSRSVALDKYTGRYYMYDNQRKDIVVRSIRFTDEICRWKTTQDRKQPILYLLYKPDVLVVVGGYSQMKGDEVQGSQILEIFKIDRWTIDTMPIIARMRTRRITPTIIYTKIDKSDCMVILGGHRLGRMSKGTISYTSYKSENSINNQKAHAVPIESIQTAIQLNIEQVVPPLNINVKFDGDLMALHNSIVVEKPFQYRTGMQILIMTESKRELYKVSYQAKTIHINISGEVLSPLSSRPPNQQHRSPADLTVVSLNTQGKLEFTLINKKSGHSRCTIF